MESARPTLALIAALAFAASTAWAQPPVPLKRVPEGFKVVSQSTSPAAVRLEASRPNTTTPNVAVDPDIHLSWNWRLIPGADKVVEMMAKSPEDSTSKIGMTIVEPAGKKMLKGGVLIFRKTTVPSLGEGNAPPWVTYDGNWIGAVEGGMLVVGVGNVAGPKETILPWITAFLDSTATPAKASPDKPAAKRPK
jgi:hypothetical protein